MKVAGLHVTITIHAYNIGIDKNKYNELASAKGFVDIYHEEMERILQAKLSGTGYEIEVESFLSPLSNFEYLRRHYDNIIEARTSDCRPDVEELICDHWYRVAEARTYERHDEWLVEK